MYEYVVIVYSICNELYCKSNKNYKIHIINNLEKRNETKSEIFYSIQKITIK